MDKLTGAKVDYHGERLENCRHQRGRLCDVLGFELVRGVAEGVLGGSSTPWSTNGLLPWEYHQGNPLQKSSVMVEIFIASSTGRVIYKTKSFPTTTVL